MSTIFLFFFLVVFLDGRNLQDCSVTLQIVYLLILYAEEGPLGSTVALRQALDQRDQLLFDRAWEGWDAQNPEETEDEI